MILLVVSSWFFVIFVFQTRERMPVPHPETGRVIDFVLARCSPERRCHRSMPSRDRGVVLGFGSGFGFGLGRGYGFGYGHGLGSLFPGLLVRLRRPSVARAAWSFGVAGRCVTTLLGRRRPPSEPGEPSRNALPEGARSGIVWNRREPEQYADTMPDADGCLRPCRRSHKKTAGESRRS